MSDDETRYDQVQKPEPADQPDNPLGEATDPAAAAGQAVTEATPTESSDPDPEKAADPVDAAPDLTPEQEATAHAEGDSDEG